MRIKYESICTNPDTYRWQRHEEYIDGCFGYAMCEVLRLGSGHYAVLYGTIDPDSGYEDDAQSIADYFGYDVDLLLSDKALFAEAIFEYYLDEFAENPYGLSPVYKTAQEACARCDKLMGESHEDMWLTK